MPVYNISGNVVFDYFFSLIINWTVVLFPVIWVIHITNKS